MVDVTRFIDKDRKLVWDPPADHSVGVWAILRIGSRLSGRMISNPGSGPEGLEIDPMSSEAMDLHFAATGAK